MGLKERAKNWIFGGPRAERGSVQSYSDGSGIFINKLIDLSREENRINNNVDLAKRYVNKAMRFTDLTMADRYEVVANSMYTWYEKMISDYSDDPVNSNDYTNQSIIWRDFMADPVSRRNFESFPDNYSELRFIDDFRGQLAVFLETNGYGGSWYGKISANFVSFYNNIDNSLLGMGYMAMLLEEKHNSYIRADDYLKAYNIWAKNWRRLDEVRASRTRLCEMYEKSNL